MSTKTKSLTRTLLVLITLIALSTKISGIQHDILLDYTHCYQETANESSGCGGLNNGNYSSDGSATDWSPHNLWLDGIISTKSESPGSYAEANINYSIPPNVDLTTTYLSVTYNFTNLTQPTEQFALNPLCINTTLNIIMLNYEIQSGRFRLYCGPAHTVIYNIPSGVTYFNEEAINWSKTDQKSINISLNYNTSIYQYTNNQLYFKVNETLAESSNVALIYNGTNYIPTSTYSIGNTLYNINITNNTILNNVNPTNISFYWTYTLIYNTTLNWTGNTSNIQTSQLISATNYTWSEQHNKSITEYSNNTFFLVINSTADTTLSTAILSYNGTNYSTIVYNNGTNLTFQVSITNNTILNNQNPTNISFLWWYTIIQPQQYGNEIIIGTTNTTYPYLSQLISTNNATFYFTEVTNVSIQSNICLGYNCSIFNATNFSITLNNISLGHATIAFNNKGSTSWQQAYVFNNQQSQTINISLLIDQPTIVQQVKVTSSGGQPLTDIRVCAKKVGTNPVNNQQDWIVTTCAWTNVLGIAQVMLKEQDTYQLCADDPSYNTVCQQQTIMPGNTEVYGIQISPNNGQNTQANIQTTCPNPSYNSNMTCQISITANQPINTCLDYTDTTGHTQSCMTNQQVTIYAFLLNSLNTPQNITLSNDGNQLYQWYYIYNAQPTGFVNATTTPAIRNRLASTAEGFIVFLLVIIAMSVFVAMRMEKYIPGSSIPVLGVIYMITAIATQVAIFYVPGIAFTLYFLYEKVIPLIKVT